MAGSPLEPRDPLDAPETPLGSRICAACGAKVREDRVRCLRCGADMAAGLHEPSGDRSPYLALLAGIAAVVGLAVVLGVLVMRRSPTPAANRVGPSVPGPSVGAVNGNPLQDTPTPPDPFATPVTATDSTRLGTVMYDAGNVEESLAHFQAAVEKNPNDPETLNNLGQLLVRSGKPADAIPYFDRAIAVAGTKWAYEFNRARAYALAGDWKRAVTGYKAALVLFPDDYATQFNLAKALEASGDLPGAIAGYERAITLAPGQADFHLTHARALEAAKRVPEAVAAYDRFLDLAPDAPEADKVKAYRDQLKAQP